MAINLYHPHDPCKPKSTVRWNYAYLENSLEEVAFYGAVANGYTGSMSEFDEDVVSDTPRPDQGIYLGNLYNTPVVIMLWVYKPAIYSGVVLCLQNSRYRLCDLKGYLLRY